MIWSIVTFPARGNRRPPISTEAPAVSALYKFRFYTGRLAEAEQAVLDALRIAARKAGITSDWRAQSRDSADWSDTRGAAHFYLFSLKALAFIRLRLGRRQEAGELLDKLAELDDGDGVGASVIRSLSDGVQPLRTS